MVTDSVANLLTLIRNAQRAGHRDVKIPSSKMNKSILNVLQSEGFITDIEEVDAGSFKKIRVGLKYFSDSQPLMRQLKRISKPGCRVYSHVKDFQTVTSGLGIALISTSQGVMTDAEAKKKNVGGEVLAIIG